MATCFPATPRSCAATPTAQAPLPQAKVSPTPRSHVRCRSRLSDTRSTNSTLTRLGNAGWFSIRGPWISTGAESTSSTKTTAWGLPMETQVTSTPSDPSSSFASTTGPSESPRVVGISAGARMGGPMSTATRSGPAQRGTTVPPRVSTRISSFFVIPRSRRYLKKVRSPFPHISTSPPSAFQISMRKSALAESLTTSS